VAEGEPVTAVVLRGDAAALPLPGGSVDLIVTSPPYHQLRAYQDGGEAYAGQIGAEETPEQYVDALIGCTREWVRCLKPTGSLFLNLGDAYSNKGLRGLPWRYAIRCVDQLGLILRAEIIWAKPNGLPESVTDRVRRSHEQVFHFVKQPRYYSAVDEVREAYSDVLPDGRRNPVPTTPGIVVDPFGGTGTTALVASCLGRVGITVDMSADYCRLARWRTSDPGERARVLEVPKPEKPVEGQLGLFEGLGA
jgi:DNA modification methylase